MNYGISNNAYLGMIQDISAGKLADLVQTSLGRRKEVEAILAGHVPKLQQEAQINFISLRQIIDREVLKLNT